ncbi:hypothetical protein V7111_19710 [Neobacillus niacini]|uniref:hypothetical protein n=1 Tax=Neobacillus niacini TaxID=86668 RepID=UPI003001CB6B
MFFTPKVQTVGSIKDFLAPSPGLVGEAVTVGALGAMGILLVSKADTVLGAGIAEKIIGAFDPLIQLIQGISYPVGFIMITAGFLVMMTGNRQKGLNMIKWAAIGYIGMQFAPAIMAILVEVAKAMK